MAGALKKTMVYLGLAEDDRYDDYYDAESYDEEPGGATAVRPSEIRESRTEPRAEAHRAETHRVETHRSDSHRSDNHRSDNHGAEVTPMPRRATLAPVAREEARPTLSRITTIHPRTYNDAKNIGEAFREGVPVIMNLTDMGDADAKRLVDFAAGLVFGLHGSIERVTAKVFLLSPENVEVATEETSPEAPRELFNQS